MAKKSQTPAQKKFIEKTKEAKKLYATGKFKKYTDAVKKVWKDAK